jgi:phosphate:Na+ symporter
MSLAHLMEKRKNKGLVIDGSEIDIVYPATLIADEFLRFLSENATRPIGDEQLAQAADFEDKLDQFRSSMKKRAKKRLNAGAEVKAELLFIDMVRHIEKIGDFAFDVARALRAMR